MWKKQGITIAAVDCMHKHVVLLYTISIQMLSVVVPLAFPFKLS